MDEVPPAQAAADAPGRGWRLLAADLVKYGLGSAGALATDAALLIGLTRIGVHYLIAAAIGFGAGMIVIYGLSIGFVFRGRRAVRPAGEFAIFLGVGLGGLALTQLLLRGFVEGLGFSPVLAKVPTAAIVFLFNFIARRALLFSPAAGRPGPAS